MTSHADRDIQYQKVAKLWGNSWQKLSPKQQQLVGDIMQDVKLVSVAEHLEAEASRMPTPDFASVTQNSQLPDFGDRDNRNSIIVTWQSILAKNTALLTEQSSLEQLRVVVRELDYQQITKNAINDVCTIVRQPAELRVMVAIEAQIARLQELLRQYFARPSSRLDTSLQADIIYATSTLVSYTKSLNISGLGAFVLTANLHLLLLQEKAKSELEEWKNLSDILNDYITHAKTTTPQLFRLSVGKIDKTCKCIKYTSQQSLEDDVTECECRYSDGENIYLFRDCSIRVGYECNKHRLKMFYSTVDVVLQTVAQPVRSTVKIWEKLANQISTLAMARGDT